MMHTNKALFRGIFVRRFTAEPNQTSYYRLAVEDLDTVFGPKRVESSRVEATMRRIAQKLFLYDDAQRALIEQEIKEDEKQFAKGDHLQYLRDFVDARDIAPRPLPISQTKLAKELRQILETNKTSIVQEVANVLWMHPIRRRSTYQMVARELLNLGHGQAAQHIMESLLMATKKRSASSVPLPESDSHTTQTSLPTAAPATSASASPLPVLQNNTSFDQTALGNSAYTLCLELAMANDDHSWFLELSKVRNARAFSALQHKFELTTPDPAIELMLAEGFMKFGHPHLLDEILIRNKNSPFYVKLLAVSMEMAVRFNDEARALATFDEFVKRFDPSRDATVRFLLLARKHPSTMEKAAEYVPKLTPKKQKLYKRKEPVWQYIHPYAN